MKSVTDVFAQEKLSKDIFNSEISNWTSCRTIQGVIVLVTLNRPRATRSSDLKLLARLLPELYSTQSNN